MRYATGRTVLPSQSDPSQTPKTELSAEDVADASRHRARIARRRRRAMEAIAEAGAHRSPSGLESLEPRVLFSAGPGIGLDEPIVQTPAGIAAVLSDAGASEDDTPLHGASLTWSELSEMDFLPTMLAGDATGTPSDSPNDRVDPNTVDSLFAGVGSLNVGGQFLCTGAAVGSTFVLTAAHCLDPNSDGTIDFADDRVTFRLNYGGNLTHNIKSVALYVHPEYTGFANPSLNDDLALIELESPLPDGVPIYPLQRAPIALETTLTLVGYGRSGYGDTGITTGSSFTIKRVGQNNADIFAPQDDAGGPARDELVFYDFDGPDASSNLLGGGTLGNDIETMLAPGDSGGPAFYYHDGEYHIAALNNFTQSASVEFGSLGGGVLVQGYTDWIDGIIGAELDDAPMALDDAYIIDVNQMLVVDAPGVLTNDVDPEGGLLTSLLMDGPTHGILDMAEDGTFTYQPDLDYVGLDSFTYIASDGSSASGLATVGINIKAPLIGDLNGDGLINAGDLSIIGALWMDPQPGTYDADLNGDGLVNVNDLAIMAANWTGDASGSSAVIETSQQGAPTSAALAPDVDNHQSVDLINTFANAVTGTSEMPPTQRIDGASQDLVVVDVLSATHLPTDHARRATRQSLAWDHIQQVAGRSVHGTSDRLSRLLDSSEDDAESDLPFTL